MHRICLWQDIAEHDPDARFVDNLRSAANGATRWRYQSSKPMIGGVVVTGGGRASLKRAQLELSVIDTPSRDHIHTVVRTPNGNDYSPRPLTPLSEICFHCIG